MSVRLKQEYNTVIREKLQNEYGYKNRFEIPKLAKIVVNMGVGEAAQDSKKINFALSELTSISGQKAVATAARKSIAGFKLREGSKVGAKVTLRGARMYEFLDRLVNIAMPLIRDFRGLSNKSFDGRGNYTFGLKEQLIFPEIDYDKIDTVRGMDITIVTTAKNDKEALTLLREFHMPIH